MHWTTLTAFVALELVLCLVPGPAVMAVVGAALIRGRDGLSTACGILTGNLVYFVASALGIATIVHASHNLFTPVKWCGAAYLAYLGMRALTGKETETLSASPVKPGSRSARAWVTGTITQLANPKALVFFAAILPQFIDPRGNLALQLAILGVASLVVEFCVLSLYVLAAGNIRKRGIAPRSRALVQRVGGAFLIGVAAAVLRESP